MLESVTLTPPRVGLPILIALGVLAAFVGGLVAAASPALLVGAGAAAALTGLAMWRPDVGISIWLVATILIPSWSVISVSGVTAGPSYLAIPVALALVIRRVHRRAIGRELFHFSIADFAVSAGVALVLAYQVLFDQEQFLATNVVIALFGGYILGRASGVPLRRVFAVSMVAVAIWGIAEFAFSLHLFTGWQADLQGLGPVIQERGGLARSETSLGHAIAYGACLAAAIPFTTLFRRPVVFQAIILVGVLVSLSRGPILASVFTFAILLFAARSAKNRAASAALLVVGLVAVYVVFTFLYNGSGQSEVESSGQARDNQLAGALGYVNWFGPADGTQLDSAGRYVTNGVGIVDSAPLRLGLDFGWVVCALLLVPVVLAAFSVLRRRAGLASITIAGQIPILLVTSFITQWQTLFFFLAGLAITELVEARDSKGQVVRDKIVSSAI